MKKIAKVLLLCICLLPMVVFAQQPVKVAVYVTGGKDDDMNEVLRSRIMSGFVASDRYSAIERLSVFKDQVDKEIDYGRSGRVDEKSIARVGREFGAEVVCAAVIQNDGFGEHSIVAKMIDVESAQVKAQTEWYGILNNSQQFRNASDKICGALTKNTSALRPHIRMLEFGNLTSSTVTCRAESSTDPFPIRATVVCQKYWLYPNSSSHGPLPQIEEMWFDVYSGESTDENKSEITDRGFVWGTSPNPTKQNSNISVSSGSGVYSGTITGLTVNTTYYVRAYATNRYGTSYSAQMEVTIIPAYLNLPTFTFNGHTYKVAPDPTTSVSEGISYELAKNYCNNLTAYGFDDWRMPTDEELEMMYFNRKNIGGFFCDDGVYTPYYLSQNNVRSWKDGRCPLYSDMSNLRNTGRAYKKISKKEEVKLRAHVRPIRLDH